MPGRPGALTLNEASVARIRWHDAAMLLALSNCAMLVSDVLAPHVMCWLTLHRPALACIWLARRHVPE